MLVEGVSKKNEATLTGRTEGFKLVDFAGNRDLIGQMVDVEITEGKTFSLSGKSLKNKNTIRTSFVYCRDNSTGRGEVFYFGEYEYL